MSHDIPVRHIRFSFIERSGAHWQPNAIEWGHMVNGASLVMPYLEPFLVKNIKQAIPLLADEHLVADAEAFIGQEAQHFTNHRRYNAMLQNSGYVELAEVEAYLQERYAALAQRSLAWRLAYTAGFESMTMGITEWLIEDRAALFADADPVVTSLVLWHMVEETEHKSVAYDVFQAVSGNYWLRLFGLVYGSFHVGLLSRRGYMAMLKRDGRWYDWRSRWRLWRMVGRFYRKAGRAMWRAALPGHHPDHTSDPQWINTWQAAHRSLDGDQIPLLNTQHGLIEPATT